MDVAFWHDKPCGNTNAYSVVNGAPQHILLEKKPREKKKLDGAASSHDILELEFEIDVMQSLEDITDVVFGPEQEEPRKVLCKTVLPEQVNSWD